ncbi:hypothetical protein BDR05DRAFT_953441 [Suillus weaverae]|nr:hypothetical protein BDR05DRAFT_953441 [Suillus weaverae]
MSSALTHDEAPASRVMVRWDHECTNALVQFLNSHPANCCVLFNESKKAHDPTIEEPSPSGSKSNIWLAIARHVFEKNKDWSVTKSKKHCSVFKQTGTGINLLDASRGKNLREQVLIQFPWFEVLDGLWKDNLAFVLIMTSSAPGINHASGMAVLTAGKHKGKQTMPPPPYPPDIDGDYMETPDMFNDIADLDTVVQGKGKEKALPLPDPVADEPMDFLDSDLDHTIIHNVPPIEPSAFGHLGGHTLADEDAMDDQPWEMFGMPQDEVLEQDGQEDESIILQRPSTKCPYSSPSLPPTYAPDATDATRFPSHGKFQTHADHALNCGSLCSPKPPSTIASSLSSSSRRTHTTSSGLSPSTSPSAHKPGTTYKPPQKSNLSKCMDAKIQDVQGQV